MNDWQGVPHELMQNKDTKKEFTLVSSHNRQEFKSDTKQMVNSFAMNPKHKWTISGIRIGHCGLLEAKGGDEVETQ